MTTWKKCQRCGSPIDTADNYFEVEGQTCCSECVELRTTNHPPLRSTP